MNSQDLALSNFILSNGKKTMFGNERLVEIQPEVSQSNYFNKTVKFRLKKEGDFLLKRVYLRSTLSAPSGYSGGAYTRFVQAIAFRMFNNIILRHSGNKIQEIQHSDELVYDFLKSIPHEKYEKIRVDIGYGSAAERNTYAGAAQELCIDLSMIFDLFRYVLPISLLENESIELEFQIPDSPKLVQTDHSTKGTESLTNFRLDCIFVDHPLILRKFVEQHNSGGIFFDIHDYHRIEQASKTVAGLQTEYVNLDDLRESVVIQLLILARSVSSLTTDYAYDYSTLQAITEVAIQNNSNNIYFKQSGNITRNEYQKILLNHYNFPNLDLVYTGNEYHMYFGEDGDKEFGDHHEHKVFQGGLVTHPYKNMRLIVELDTTAQRNIYVYARIKSKIRLLNGRIVIPNKPMLS